MNTMNKIYMVATSWAVCAFILLTCDKAPTASGQPPTYSPGPELAWTSGVDYDGKFEVLYVTGMVINRSDLSMTIIPKVMLSSDEDGAEIVSIYEGTLSDSVYYNQFGVPLWFRTNEKDILPSKSSTHYLIETESLTKYLKENKGLYYYIWFDIN